MLSELEYAERLRSLVPQCARDAPDNPLQKRMTAADEARLRGLWQIRATLEDISKQMRVDRRVVQRWVAELDLPKRAWGLPVWSGIWPSADDAFLLRWFRRRPAAWIGCNLPSGRKVSRNAVIGRHARLRKKLQASVSATPANGEQKLEA